MIKRGKSQAHLFRDLTLGFVRISSIEFTESTTRTAEGVTMIILASAGKESGTRFALGLSSVNIKLK
jgi:hypothetical protein